MRYYDRDGRRIEREEWERLRLRPDYCHIAFTELGDDDARRIVITTWLGLVVDPYQEPPLIFRTIAGDYRGDTLIAGHHWDWPTEEAARLGHARATARPAALPPPPDRGKAGRGDPSLPHSLRPAPRPGPPRGHRTAPQRRRVIQPRTATRDSVPPPVPGAGPPPPPARRPSLPRKTAGRRGTRDDTGTGRRRTGS
ncbi:hypothetical protein [Nonomuraea sp. NPDC003214]